MHVTTVQEPGRSISAIHTIPILPYACSNKKKHSIRWKKRYENYSNHNGNKRRCSVIYTSCKGLNWFRAWCYYSHASLATHPWAKDLLQSNGIAHTSAGSDYEWIFKHAAIVIHHFGFGTTAEVLKAGLRSIPIPHFIDQNMRANELHKLGLCSKPLKLADFTGKQLADRIIETKKDIPMEKRVVDVSKEIEV